MGTKVLKDNLPYNNCYHFVASTKYRKNVFNDEAMRERLAEIINDTLTGMELTDCLAVAVAYNHIHVLVKSEIELSKISQKLYGVTSRVMRKEYPSLMMFNKNSLWGGKSCAPIKDETHLRNCYSYINRHQPDNTKLEN